MCARKSKSMLSNHAINPWLLAYICAPLTWPENASIAIEAAKCQVARKFVCPWSWHLRSVDARTPNPAWESTNPWFPGKLSYYVYFRWMKLIVKTLSLCHQLRCTTQQVCIHGQGTSRHEGTNDMDRQEQRTHVRERPSQSTTFPFSIIQ
jgi:hypothetical protein